MRIYAKFKILLIIIIFSHNTTYSQHSELKDKNSVLKHAEAKYGVNDLLVNGKIYFPLHENVSGHPFYPTNDFVNADIFIKRNTFRNILLRFDIEQQQMIIKIGNNENSMKLITLNPFRVDSIIFEDRIFIPSKNISKQLPENRYYEILWNKSFQFIIFYYKKFDPNNNRQSPNPGRYTIDQSEKILIFQDKVIRVNNKKYFLNQFKSIKKEIRHFMKLNSIKYNKADISQLKQLIQYCYETHTSN